MGLGWGRWAPREVGARLAANGWRKPRRKFTVAVLGVHDDRVAPQNRIWLVLVKIVLHDPRGGPCAESGFRIRHQWETGPPSGLRQQIQKRTPWTRNGGLRRRRWKRKPRERRTSNMRLRWRTRTRRRRTERRRGKRRSHARSGQGPPRTVDTSPDTSATGEGRRTRMKRTGTRETGR